MSVVKEIGLRAALLAAVLFVAPYAATAQFNQFVGFGDSTMDSGYFRYNPTGGGPQIGHTNLLDLLIKATVAAGGSGAFAGPGGVDTELLAARFGLSATPFIVGGGGGTNYANGSAQTVFSTSSDGYLSGLYNNVPTVIQISTYLASVHNVANPHALYMIGTGANDLVWLQKQSASQSPEAQTKAWATTLAVSVANLQAAGARSIVVLNTYFYADLVGANGILSPTNATNYAEAKTYGGQIWSALTAAGVNFIPADINDLLKYASQNPAKFGFTAATVLASDTACGKTPGLLCTTSQLVAPDAEQTHLFADPSHLATAGQTIESDYIYSLLAGPKEISLIPESAVQRGLSLATTVMSQLDFSRQSRGPSGIDVWVDASANTLRVKNAADFPNDSGTPFGGTLGADYQTRRGVILGAALTSGDQTQQFSSGGYFDQVGEALSLYSGYKAGPLWGAAVATYSLYQDHVARLVTLGNFIDSEQRPRERTVLGACIASRGRFPSWEDHHRPAGRHSAATGASRWLHRNWQQWHHCLVVRQSTAEFVCQPTRMAWNG
jgi:outer membrane lipase/esterase